VLALARSCALRAPRVHPVAAFLDSDGKPDNLNVENCNTVENLSGGKSDAPRSPPPRSSVTPRI